MTTRQDYEVLFRFLSSGWIAAEGVRAERTLSGPVALWRRGDYLGIWWHADGEYRFGSAAFRDIERRANTPDEALAKTLSLIVRRRSASRVSA